MYIGPHKLNLMKWLVQHYTHYRRYRQVNVKMLSINCSLYVLLKQNWCLHMRKSGCTCACIGRGGNELETNRKHKATAEEKCQCSRYKSEQYSLWLRCIMNTTIVCSGFCGVSCRWFKNIEFCSECSHLPRLHLSCQQLSTQIINVSNKTLITHINIIQ
jgi:hypothetical protein